LTRTTTSCTAAGGTATKDEGSAAPYSSGGESHIPGLIGSNNIGIIFHYFRNILQVKAHRFTGGSINPDRRLAGPHRLKLAPYRDLTGLGLLCKPIEHRIIRTDEGNNRRKDGRGEGYAQYGQQRITPMDPYLTPA
jgi:hypothetical protein